MTSLGASSQDDLESIWQRQQIFWHVVFALMWSGALAVTVLDDPGPAGRGVEVACLVGVAGAYAVLGARALAGEDGRLAAAYLVIAWSLVIAMQWLNPGTETWMLFFALFPHTWALIRRWQAIATTAVVTLLISAIRWQQSAGTGEAMDGIVLSGTVSLVLSLGLGLFITSMVHEASARAETIDELRAAQDRLAAAERESGVAQERERLSREIHDTLAQGFTSVLTLTRATRAALGRGDVETVRARLDLIEQTAKENLHEARLMVAELTPGHLQSRSLMEALERLAGTVGAESAMAVSLRSAGTPTSLGGAVDVMLLRTAQEALTNARKHARATSVEMVLDYGDPVRLTVRDDGRGFDPSLPRSGFGLDGLRSRVGSIGGRVAVLSAPGSGTEIAVSVPRPPESAVLSGATSDAV